MKKPRYVTNPKAASLRKLWSGEQVTLSLGACDYSERFNDPRASRVEPTWLGYLHVSDDKDGLLPTTLHLHLTAPGPYDDLDTGSIGRGYLEDHADFGHLHYMVHLFDAAGSLSRSLNDAFLKAAVCRQSWVQLSLWKPPMDEALWLSSWQTRRLSSSHQFKSSFVHSRVKLPDAPVELFDWVQSGDVPTGRRD